ncbi:MAG: 16S rRNA (cytosine(1402)-N(4))-methyltransferase RsmH [Thiofilum sp.]|uniref:16S rRNA (cytosine(1402)-N(4))-methyltransferase RsmH n=1 Tax=Thiofilum sp. TaxID=2212733 RepID=UPI0025E04F0D|nr:16S rRNA (cytosine(1402)-N(4))-methyltransferase RsmH [Thiofilum sp.]MBK8453203.1 16S rRNA (cytosine(1402)-N(4))-methyltransferase RsmH [Thiofilum sp.]
MMTAPFTHDSVLLSEAVNALMIRPDGLYIDGTYGRGGHSALILQSLGAQGKLLVIDKDPSAIEHARLNYQNDPRVVIWQGSFKDFDSALQACNLARPNGLLLDLGVSSPQLDDAERGFSFMRQGALDMRMNPQHGMSAADWVNSAAETEIADVLWRYGEERFSRQIARKIVQTRTAQPLTTTLQLAELIAHAIPKKEPHKHPATRSFQAIRIKINEELQDIETCLVKTLDHLALGGRLSIISFHSLEDRLVKQFMREYSTPKRLPKGLPILDDQTEMPPLKLIGKGLRASEQEIATNIRARSALLRIAERMR